MKTNNGRARMARRMSVLVCAGLMLAACGGDDGDDSGASTTSTTTTEAPDTTTTTAEEPIQPFTGRPLSDESLLDRRPIVAKYGNNTALSQPHWGLDHTDIVFEEQIEAESTRFAAVFHSDLPDQLGPSLRSARSSDIEIIANLGNPVLVDSGSNLNVKAELDDAQSEGLLTRVTDMGAPPFMRVEGRGTREETLAADTGGVIEIAGEAETEPTPIFAYGDAFDGSPSPGVRLNASYAVEWVWDAGSGQYLRYQFGDPAMVTDEAQMTADNVVVMEVDYAASATPGSPEAVTVGTGPAWVMRGGEMQQGNWARFEETAPYVLTGLDEEPIELAPGNTWVILAWLDSYEELDAETADGLLAAARVPQQ